MILNIWDNIKLYFQEFFTKNLIGNLITLFFGIIIGIMIVFLFYGITVLIDIKKVDKEVKKIEEDEKDLKIKNDEVREIIDLSLSRYDDISKSLFTADKIKDHISVVSDIIALMVKDIAKVYYPDSKYSFGEISLKELMDLIRYILDRIDEIFEKHRTIRVFKRLTISLVLNSINKISEINNNKIVKNIKKYNIDEAASTFLKIKNIINPVVWVRKLTINKLIKYGLPKLVRSILEIIGSEAAKVYSKSLFNKENKITINDEELLIEELNDED